jgi:hypothetical protein
MLGGPTSLELPVDRIGVRFQAHEAANEAADAAPGHEIDDVACPLQHVEHADMSKVFGAAST